MVAKVIIRKENLYATLGLDSKQKYHITQEQIDDAYLELRDRFHPNRFGAAKLSEEKQKQDNDRWVMIDYAYKKLGNRYQRFFYDNNIEQFLDMFNYLLAALAYFCLPFKLYLTVMSFLTLYKYVDRDKLNNIFLFSGVVVFAMCLVAPATVLPYLSLNGPIATFLEFNLDSLYVTIPSFSLVVAELAAGVTSVYLLWKVDDYVVHCHGSWEGAISSLMHYFNFFSNENELAAEPLADTLAGEQSTHGVLRARGLSFDSSSVQPAELKSENDGGNNKPGDSPLPAAVAVAEREKADFEQVTPTPSYLSRLD